MTPLTRKEIKHYARSKFDIPKSVWINLYSTGHNRYQIVFTDKGITYTHCFTYS